MFILRLQTTKMTQNNYTYIIKGYCTETGDFHIFIIMFTPRNIAFVFVIMCSSYLG